MLNRGLVGVALIITLLILLSGCATNGMSREERLQAYNEYISNQNLESQDRVSSFRLNGWTDLGDRHLIVRSGVNRLYLIELRNDCWELDSTLTIKVNTTGSILRTRFDSISVPGDLHQRCFIENIYPISKEQRKELLGLHKIQDKEIKVEESDDEETNSSPSKEMI